MHAMYALMNTWLMTTRADGSLDAANGGQHATSCHASAGHAESFLGGLSLRTPCMH